MVSGEHSAPQSEEDCSCPLWHSSTSVSYTDYANIVKVTGGNVQLSDSVKLLGITLRLYI